MATFADVITKLQRQRQLQEASRIELVNKNQTLLEGIKTAAGMAGISVRYDETQFSGDSALTEIEIDFPAGLELVEKKHTFGLEKVESGYKVILDGIASYRVAEDSQSLLDDFLELMQSYIRYPEI